jgi:hypothetical protein
MIEKSGFSLIRAGVMTGLMGIIFLLVGIFNQYDREDPTAKVHLSENLWTAVESLLAHVKASPKLETSLTPLPRCTSGSLGHERLISRIGVFNQQLNQLYKQGYLTQLYQLDAGAWLSDSDQRAMSCAEANKPLQWLLAQTRKSGMQFLETLQWKERQPTSRHARYSGGSQVSMSQQAFIKRSPWNGLKGCVFWTDAITGKPLQGRGASKASQAFCEGQFQLITQNASSLVVAPLVPGLPQVLEPLDSWRMPQSEIYQRLVGERNQLSIKGKLQPVGLHPQLGIDPRWQNSLQAIAQCFSGEDSPLCKGLATGGSDRYEGARVRMAGLAIVDVPTGRLVVAASASSPCFLHDKSRSGLAPKDCPIIKEGNVHRPRLPQTQTNHALFTQAPPGSLVKPLMMAGILRSPQPKSSLNGLEMAMQSSNSQQFLDAMLCRSLLGSGSFSADCDRPKLILESIHHLGWNAGCDGQQDWQRSRCGKIDLLRGTALAETPVSVDIRLLEANLYRPVQLPVLAGQLMVESAANDAPGWQDIKLSGRLPTPEQRLSCSKSGSKSGKGGYVRCGGARMALVSEGYGQGNAMTTPVGVAGMLGVMASSAQGLPVRYPHLIQNFWTTQGQPDDVTHQLFKRQGLAIGPQGLSPEISRHVLQAMETTHAPGGSANAECKKVMGDQVCLSNLGVAGKTGTPGDTDNRSLEKLMLDQSLNAECLALGKLRCNEAHPLPRPRYRWYAALFKTAGSQQYDKAIAVLVHSNWRRADGLDSDKDNAAAEIAFHAIKKVRDMKATP